MARRSFLPPHVQNELPERARYGLGHDMTAPTLYKGETITAYQARLREPSPEMYAVVKNVWKWLESKGGTSVGIMFDIRHAKHPGCVTLSWSGGPSAKDAATQFATSYSDDALPMIPGWLSFKSDDDWDLRWQPTYGEITDPNRQTVTNIDEVAPPLTASAHSRDDSEQGYFQELTIPGL